MPVNLQEMIELLKASGRAKEPGARNALLQFMLAKKPKSENLARLESLQQAQFTEILKREAFENIISPNPFSEPPSEEDLGPGDITVGSVLDRDRITFEFKLPIEIFQEHVGLFGHSGSGKSWTTKFVVSQLINAGVACWLFDEHDEYKNLALLFPPESLVALDCRDFKRNPYEVLLGEHPMDTLNRIKDVSRSSLYLRDGSENLLGEILNSMYQKFGVFQGSGNFPTQFDLNKELSRLRYRVNTRHAGYLETLVNRSLTLCNYMGSIYDCVAGYDLRALMKKSVLFRLQGLNEYCKDFFRNDLFMAIQALRASCTSELQLVLVIDEANKTFSKVKAFRQDLGEIIPNQMIRGIRKRGVGCILADQVPSEMHPAVIGNLGTRIAFRLLDGHCIRAIGDSMSLSPEQRECITELPKRVAIVQAGHYPLPFLVRVPELQFEEGVSEQELRARLEAVRPLLAWVPKETEVACESAGDEESARERTDDEEKHGRNGASWPGVTKDALDYLIEIVKDPFLPVSKRDALLGTSDWKGDAMRNELLNAGLVAKEVINTHRRGGMVTLMRVTETGYVMLDALKVRHSKPRGKGGFEHQFWQAMIAKWAVAKGYEAEIEGFRDGKAADVAVRMAGREVAFEVVNEKWEKEIINFSKDTWAGWDEIAFCCADRETIEKIKKKISDVFGKEAEGKASFRLLAEFAEGL